MLDERETAFLFNVPYLVWFVPGSGRRFEAVQFDTAEQIVDWIVEHFGASLTVRTVWTEKGKEGEGVE